MLEPAKTCLTARTVAIQEPVRTVEWSLYRSCQHFTSTHLSASSCAGFHLLPQAAPTFPPTEGTLSLRLIASTSHACVFRLQTSQACRLQQRRGGTGFISSQILIAPPFSSLEFVHPLLLNNNTTSIHKRMLQIYLNFDISRHSLVYRYIKI
jgi:hypothetical protein